MTSSQTSRKSDAATKPQPFPRGRDEEPDEVAESGASSESATPLEDTAPEDTAPPGSGDQPERVASTERAGGRVSRLVRAALRPGRLAVAALVLAVLAGATGAWLEIDRSRGVEQARESALREGPGYAAAFLSYDFQDPQAGQRDVVPHISEKLAGEYGPAMQQLAPIIQESKAVVKANVVKAAVMEADDERAVLLAFLDQNTTNTSTPQPRLDRSRVQITLQRAGDGWVLDGIDLT